MAIAPDDKIASAIAAAEQPEPVAMTQFNVTIASTGRPAAIALPADATDGEVAEVCGWVLSVVLNTYRAERAKAAASRILVPSPPTLVRA